MPSRPKIGEKKTTNYELYIKTIIKLLITGIEL